VLDRPSANTTSEEYETAIEHLAPTKSAKLKLMYARGQVELCGEQCVVGKFGEIDSDDRQGSDRDQCQEMTYGDNFGALEVNAR
jgi:hypothetical protein